jgi:hypothetical protein
MDVTTLLTPLIPPALLTPSAFHPQKESIFPRHQDAPRYFTKRISASSKRGIAVAAPTEKFNDYADKNWP